MFDSLRRRFEAHICPKCQTPIPYHGVGVFTCPTCGVRIKAIPDDEAPKQEWFAMKWFDTAGIAALSVVIGTAIFLPGVYVQLFGTDVWMQRIYAALTVVLLTLVFNFIMSRLIP